MAAAQYVPNLEAVNFISALRLGSGSTYLPIPSLTVADTCLQRCSVSYGTERVPCDANAAHCWWSTANSSCVQRCESIQSWGSCNSYPECYFDSGAGKCLTRCPFLTLAACANQSDIFTVNRCEPSKLNAQVCAAKCAIWDGNATACDVMSPRDCYYSNGTVDKASEKGCLGHCFTTLRSASAIDCQNRNVYCTFFNGLAHWNPGQVSGLGGPLNSDLGHCATSCGYATRSRCGQAGFELCAWHSANNVCVPDCYARYSNSSTTCDADPSCTWFGSAYSRGCRQSCGSYNVTSAHCLLNSSNACMYHDSNATTPTKHCRRNCQVFSSSADCVLESFCEWAVHPSKTVTTFRDGVAVFSAANSSCLRKCSNLDKYICPTYSHCVLASDGTCRLRCKHKYYNIDQSKFVTDCSADTNCAVVDQTCRDSCTSQGEATCVADLACAWTPQGTCRNRCSLSSLRTEGACNAVTSCQSSAIDTAVCREKCTQHTNRTQCSQDWQCTWLNVTSRCASNCYLMSPIACNTVQDCELAQGSCIPTCASRGDSATCLSFGKCQWNYVNATCTRRCDSLYTKATSSACISDKYYCQFLEPSSQCLQHCGQFNLSEALCLSATHCVWLRNATCVPRCNVLATTATASACVAAAPLCDPDAQTGQCSENCSLAASPSMCDSLAHCRWNVTGAQCIRGCAALYSGQANCDAASDCQWTNEGCRARCTLYVNEPACRNATTKHCLWDGDSAMCVLPCPRIPDATRCNATMGCTFLSVGCTYDCTKLSGSNCRKLYPNCYFYPGVGCQTGCNVKYPSTTDFTSCVADSLCSPFWQVDLVSTSTLFPVAVPSQYRCGPQCTRLSYQECRVESRHCYWRDEGTPTYTGGCSPKCTNRPNNTALCGFDGQCLLSSRGCIRACSLATTSQQCLALEDTQCLWSLFRRACVPNCRYKFGHIEPFNPFIDNASFAFRRELCLQDAMCEWDNTTWLCDNRCEDTTTGSCRFGSCTTSGNTISLCSTQCNAAACLGSNPRCANDQRTVPTCRQKCSVFSDNVTMCFLYSHCTYRDGGCMLSCDFNSATCDTGRCSVISGTCRDQCTAFSSLGSNVCSARSWCEWEASTNTCIERCSTQFGTKATCDASTSCQFLSNTNACEIKCSLIKDAGLCSSTKSLSCVWLNSTNSCASDCLKKYGSNQADCAADSACRYSTSQNRCLMACNGVNAATCPLMSLFSHCLVDPVGNSCVETCAEKHNTGPFGSINKTTCDADPYCRSYQNFANGSFTCEENCAKRYNTSATCVASGRCSWDASISACYSTCSLNDFVNGTECVKVPQCLTRTTGFGSFFSERCFATCNARDSTSKCLQFYSSDYQCFWDSNFGKCRRQCSDLTVSTCTTTDSLCTTYGSLCREDCTKLNITTCGYYSYCQYRQLSASCVPTCISLRSSGVPEASRQP